MIENGDSIYLDANVFIDAVDGAPEAADPARTLLKALRRFSGRAATSELTLAEVMVPKLSPATKQAYLNILIVAGFIRLLPITRAILLDAAELLTVSSMKLPDRIHIATAAADAAGTFITRDKTVRVPAGMAMLRQNDPDLLRRLGLA